MLISESYLWGCNVIYHSLAIYAKTSILSSRQSLLAQMLHIWMTLEFFYFTKPLKNGNLDFKIQFKGI